MSRIGEQIFILRSKKGITQKQLGKQLGVSEKYVAEIESGKKIINDEFIKRISKLLGQDINDAMIFDEPKEEKDDIEVFIREEKVKDTWSDAFSSILKEVPIYKYDLKTSVGSRKLPIAQNKINGYSKDKVVYLQIQNNDMTGFRISQNDIAFGYQTNEIENNSICLLEYNSERVIRQIKRIDDRNILLIKNRGNVETDTASSKEIKILVRLCSNEIKL